MVIEDAHQTAKMRILIWVFVWRTRHKVHFMTLYFVSSCLYRLVFPISADRWTHQAKKCLWACAKCADSHHPAYTHAHSGISAPLKHSIVSNDFVCGQRRPWSACADAQADLSLPCPHMPEDLFSYGTAQWDCLNTFVNLDSRCFHVRDSHFTQSGSIINLYSFYS